MCGKASDLWEHSVSFEEISDLAMTLTILLQENTAGVSDVASGLPAPDWVSSSFLPQSKDCG